MNRHQKHLSASLFWKLAKQRDMSPLPRISRAPENTDFIKDTANWVTLWYDALHCVQSPGDPVHAYRAVTHQGQLLWFVFRTGKRHGYHSKADDPFEAIAEAKAAWRARRLARSQWRKVKALRNDLLLGRRSFRVTVDDARNSGLCELGIQGFLSRVGLGPVQHISGRLAALIMYFEPQIGHAIFAASHRVADHQVTTASEGVNSDAETVHFDGMKSSESH